MYLPSPSSSCRGSGHARPVVVVVPSWQWPRTSCHHRCCYCRHRHYAIVAVAMYVPSSSSLGYHGSGLAHSVAVVVVVTAAAVTVVVGVVLLWQWPHTSRRRRRHWAIMAVASHISLSSLSSPLFLLLSPSALCRCSSGHTGPLVVTVVAPSWQTGSGHAHPVIVILSLPLCGAIVQDFMVDVQVLLVKYAGTDVLRCASDAVFPPFCSWLQTKPCRDPTEWRH